MVTRANLNIVSNGNNHKFYISSDGYPSFTIPILKKFLQDCTTCQESLALQKLFTKFSIELGYIGNPYYYYEVDLNKNIICAWQTKPKWIKAPENWEEKGYVCHIGENNKYGYYSWRKGKKISDKEE